MIASRSFKDGQIIRVEKISDLQDHNYKRAKLELAYEGSAKGLCKIISVSNLETDSASMSFHYRGNVNAMTKKLAKLSLNDLWVVEPDLLAAYIFSMFIINSGNLYWLTFITPRLLLSSSYHPRQSCPEPTLYFFLGNSYRLHGVADVHWLRQTRFMSLTT